MRHKVKEAVFKYLLLLLLIISLCPLNGKAQNASLVGSNWFTGPIPISVVNSDNSVTTLNRYYTFYNQGQVNTVVIRDKTIGSEWSFVTEFDYDVVEHRQVLKTVRKLVYTPATSDSQFDSGTYKISGNSLSMDFLSYTVKAKIYKDSIKGVFVKKKTNEEIPWTVFAMTESDISKLPKTIDLGIAQSNSPDSKLTMPLDRDDKGNYVPGKGWQWKNQNTGVTVQDVINDAMENSKKSASTQSLRTAAAQDVINDALEWERHVNEVEPMPGLVKIAFNKLSLAKGYRWANPDDPKDLRVEKVPN